MADTYPFSGLLIRLPAGASPGSAPGSAAGRRLTIGGERFELEPLLATPAFAWHIARPVGKLSGAHAWDLAHDAVRGKSPLIAGGRGPVHVEPDLVQHWLYERPSARAALGAGCAFVDQDAALPHVPSRFAWHLDDDFSQLATARERAAETESRRRVRIAHLDTGYDPDHVTLPAHLRRDLQRNFFGDQAEDDARDPAKAGGVHRGEGYGHGVATLALLAGGRYGFDGVGSVGVGGSGGVGSRGSRGTGDSGGSSGSGGRNGGDVGAWRFAAALGGAPDAEIVPIRVGSSAGAGARRVDERELPHAASNQFLTSSVARALHYAARLCDEASTRIDVLSMSLGGFASAAWADVVNLAYDAGIVLVTAAGNNMSAGFFGYPTRLIAYPARFRRVIAACGVMASRRPYYGLPFGTMQGNWGPASKMATAMSAYAPNVPWAAIGCPQLVDMDGAGTSAATPQVAAAAALYLQAHGAALSDRKNYPEAWMRVEAVRHALFSSTDQSADGGRTERLGNGILRAAQALAVAPAPRERLPRTPADSAIFPFLDVLTGLRAGATEAADAADAMLALEATQLAQRWDDENGPNPMETSIADPDQPPDSIPTSQMRAFLDGLLDRRDTSAALRQRADEVRKSLGPSASSRRRATSHARAAAGAGAAAGSEAGAPSDGAAAVAARAAAAGSEAGTLSGGAAAVAASASAARSGTAMASGAAAVVGAGATTAGAGAAAGAATAGAGAAGAGAEAGHRALGKAGAKDAELAGAGAHRPDDASARRQFSPSPLGEGAGGEGALSTAATPAAPPRPRPQPVPFEPSAPPSRRLRGFAIDPSLAMRLDTARISEICLDVPWEPLAPGPRGEYVEVIDVDPGSRCFYEPINLDDPKLLAQNGLAPSEGTPQFHQQMVYAVASLTIRNFERALGRRVQWRPGPPPTKNPRKSDAIFVPRLRIYPHALRERNAYYSPNKIALLFGYFNASPNDPGDHQPGGMVFTCLSHDVVAHETTHALLDGMHRRFARATNPDVPAFHEAFADIVALLQHFTFPEVLRDQIAATRGEIRSQQSLLGELAGQFGRTIGGRGALRDAIGKVDATTGVWTPARPDPRDYDTVMEPHARGGILVAAVFDAFLSIYERRVADLLRLATGGSGLLRPGAIHPDLVSRLAKEAAKSAGHVLTMCVRALDYCPPVDITFGEYLRAIITADTDLVPDDDLHYRVAFVEAFRRRGLYPRDIRTLSVENLCWRSPENDESRPSRSLEDSLDHLRDFAAQYLYVPAVDDVMPPRERLFHLERSMRLGLHQWLADHFAAHPDGVHDAAYLGLDAAKPFEVHSARYAMRIGPDGQLIPQLLLGLLQDRVVPIDPADPNGIWMTFEGGSTIIVDLGRRKIRYCIRKNLESTSRLARQQAFARDASETARATYFGLRPLEETGEPFAALHRRS